MTRRANKKGRSDGSEHWTKMIRSLMDEPAWRALSPVAQALYPWMKLEWRGPENNNNGKIRLSCRQAAERIGITPNTAAKAFRDLQAKGFIVVTVKGALGIEGEARGPSYEITELAMPASGNVAGRKLYLQWLPDKEFPVVCHNINNPRGANGKRKPHHQNRDGPVSNLVTFASTPSSKS